MASYVMEGVWASAYDRKSAAQMPATEFSRATLAALACDWGLKDGAVGPELHEPFVFAEVKAFPAGSLSGALAACSAYIGAVRNGKVKATAEADAAHVDALNTAIDAFNVAHCGVGQMRRFVRRTAGGAAAAALPDAKTQHNLPAFHADDLKRAKTVPSRAMLFAPFATGN